jgi:hypothetical protein
MRHCIFCGTESFESSSCPVCGFIRNRVKEFDRISPGAGPIEFETYLKDQGMRQEPPSLALLSKIMNEVLRGGSGGRGSKHRAGIECKKIDNGYFGLV